MVAMAMGAVTAPTAVARVFVPGVLVPGVIVIDVLGRVVHGSGCYTPSGYLVHDEPHHADRQEERTV